MCCESILAFASYPALMYSCNVTMWFNVIEQMALNTFSVSVNMFGKKLYTQKIIWQKWDATRRLKWNKSFQSNGFSTWSNKENEIFRPIFTPVVRLVFPAINMHCVPGTDRCVCASVNMSIISKKQYMRSTSIKFTVYVS